MKKIQLCPKDFSFPNFCFEKKYENYLFLDSALLATSLEAEKYFFEILKELEKCGQQNNKSWDLLIPFTIQSEYRNYLGESRVWEIKKQLKKASLDELYKYFLSFFHGELKSHFIFLVDQFWMELQDTIGVYALFNGEIIVIGIKVDCNIEKIKQKKVPLFEINIIKNSTITITNGELQLSMEEKQKKVMDFFYKSFDEYVYHWGPVFKWNASQINFLKEQFSKT